VAQALREFDGLWRHLSPREQEQLIKALVETVKGGAKLDHRGGEKIDHFLGSWGFGLGDLRGRLERRPAAPGGRRV
jgi:hypothetical protein